MSNHVYAAITLSFASSSRSLSMFHCANEHLFHLSLQFYVASVLLWIMNRKEKWINQKMFALNETIRIHNV